MSKYKDIIEKMLWSYSRIMCYYNCPYAFYLKYIVDDDKKYLAEDNYYTEVGKYIHFVLEKILKNELKVEDALQYFMEHFEENVFYSTWQTAMDKTYEACADYFASIDFSWLQYYEILGIEQEIRTNIDGHEFIGYIDLLIRHKETNDIYIIDHKSSAYPFKKDGKTVLKKSEKDFDKYRKQMYLYSKYVYETYGKYPEWIVWNHFKENKIAKIQFLKNEYDDAIAWFQNEINHIESDDTFEAKLDYFYCKQLCQFRNSCEYINQVDE